MSGNTNFPSALDTDTELFDVTDGVTALDDAHHNNLKEAIKAIEAKIGINNTSVPTALDYRLGHPTDGHRHDGASGGAPKINPTTIDIPSGGIGGSTLDDHFKNRTAHLLPVVLQAGPWLDGDVAASAVLPAYRLPRTLQLDSVDLVAFRGPSGGTAIVDIHIGGTSIWHASQGHRLMVAPTSGLAVGTHGTFNTVTGASGSFVRVDLDQVGSNKGLYGWSVTLYFRE